jgi:Domain of unknown function (DUF5054)
VVIMLPWCRREDSGRHHFWLHCRLGCNQGSITIRNGPCSHCHQLWPCCCDPAHDAAKSANLGMTDCMTAVCCNARQIPEHTWGADVKAAMPDYRNWSNADFHTALAAGHYSDAVHCWRRQRAYLDWGLEALSERWSGKASVLA